MRSVRIMLWAATLVLAIIVALLGYSYTRSSGELAEGPFGVPFQLVKQDGQPITDKDLQGKPTALFFGFTHCPDVCPTTLFEMDNWLKTVDPDGTRLQALFVTVDPERDTPAVMKDYVTNVSSRITGVSGDPAKVMEMVKGFRVYAKKVPTDPAKPDGDYVMDHTASVFLLDDKGRFAGTIAYQEDPKVAETKLKNLITRNL
ncbi:SCO family protein [Gellertiella hungarica]|uniref:Protein SCO1/2 n=1 Tax=Gellertiella hungarica TaxID=1572859 RepID=A0A7W6J2K6_9HYPH|nr:SCO family protein [Gellertiella hungarica]MBB4063567.1 protein SCO1/2 [Gellertiella hungarica]